MNHIKLNKKQVFILLLFVCILVLALIPAQTQKPIRFIDRSTGMTLTEKIPGQNWLVWLYHNPVGEATLWTLVKRKMVSSIYGELMDRPSSADKIKPFVEEFKIDLSIAQRQSFTSFNDFFTRKLKSGSRPIDTASDVLISPADGKILAYADISSADFIVKGKRFDVSSFLNDEKFAKKYTDGALIIIRLAPNDYHRFHFPVGGKVTKTTKIDGDYYSVNPIALREMVEIFCLNKREFATIENPVFGKVVIAEVGATMVGSIIQTYTNGFVEKGSEKGYFEFGGSTVVLLFENGKINIDKDLLENAAKGLETYVLMGEHIASAN